VSNEQKLARPGYALAPVTLDAGRLLRATRVLGMVNVAPDFDQTPVVIDACSYLLMTSSGMPENTRKARSVQRSRSISQPRSR